VSGELRESLEVEQAMLRRLLEESAPLVARCRAEQPGSTEQWALAAMLHAFYNGVENLFRRIAMEMDGGTPVGPASHRELLDSMARPGAARPRVITDATRDRLEEYLDFRHMFRHAYTSNLQWHKMANLVLGIEAIWRQIESELQTFIDSIAQDS